MPTKPTRSIFGCCCARAASGPATAAPPSAKMNSRRLMLNIGLPPIRLSRRERLPAGEALQSVCRTLSLPLKGQQVLGADLNCPESRDRRAAAASCQFPPGLRLYFIAQYYNLALRAITHRLLFPLILNVLAGLTAYEKRLQHAAFLVLDLVRPIEAVIASQGFDRRRRREHAVGLA